MKDSTDITVLLDRSGSMGVIKDDVIGGFNEFIGEQKKAGDNAALTLVQFDSGGIESTYTATPIKNAAELNAQSYQPRASTPLLDALGVTINKTGERLAAISDPERPDKVVFVIITDGQENASREFSKLAVKNLIEQQARDYNWQFIYLGANQDSFTEAGAIGIATAAVADFAATNARGAYRSAASNLASYRTSNDVKSLAWSDEQREKLKREKA